MNQPDSPTYDPDQFEKLFKVEDRHFWFRGRNDAIESILKSPECSLPSAAPRVLEIGCGTGNTLRVLEKLYGSEAVTGMDLFEEGLLYARQRTKCRLIHGDVLHPPFESSFDLICLFDVLEHLPNDEEVLQSIHRMLSPGGLLFLTVPAHQSLWSYFDEAACHARRYEPHDLETKLKNAGFAVRYLTEFMMILHPILWLGRRLNALLKRPATAKAAEESQALLQRELHIHPLANKVFYWLLRAEKRLLERRVRLPMGSSILAIAKKMEPPAPSSSQPVP